MVRVQADKGAIPFLLSGANCMCPGLTSAGGVLPDGLSENTPVLIMIEGKEHAIGVGILKMSSEQMYAAGSLYLSFPRMLARWPCSICFFLSRSSRASHFFSENFFYSNSYFQSQSQQGRCH